ncbi:L-serine ammonia-lyase [Chromatiales bacterium (ex Bugula neritina AB1)]|nr:L-serine ammonia-lyase [Chromatiales bacterium (ex Bugula neritina AB1)]
MSLSVFDLFKIGIGPSSSHTVGPMLAACQFVNNLQQQNLLDSVCELKVQLFGSLGATGKGHGSDKAIILGLMGELPDRVDPAAAMDQLIDVRSRKVIRLAGLREISFVEKQHLILHKRKTLPYHPNGMRFDAMDQAGSIVNSGVFYSVGGGFVVDEAAATGNNPIIEDASVLPRPFTTAVQLLEQCRTHDCNISDVMFENEKVWRTEQQVREQLLEIWQVMRDCVKHGCDQEGVLPGGLKVKRRAAEMYRQLSERPEAALRDPLSILDWVNLYALAVNEENAAGGRVVTAPTNGAAGIIPAVLHYYERFVPSANEDGIVRFLLTAGAIGVLYKENASISGAEVGCQGEVGSACSMAAGALCEVMGGTPDQVENAAEIAMEHNLGLTCDPVGGLVQVPCIERNAMASIKAINAVRMALRGDGTHFVSLDKVIKTMRDTGRDMKTKYKETARGGLAINVIEVPVSIVEC